MDPEVHRAFCARAGKAPRRPGAVVLPELKGPDDAQVAYERIARALAEGRVTRALAGDLRALVDRWVRAYRIEVRDLERAARDYRARIDAEHRRR